MIYITGDTHGDFSRISLFCYIAKTTKEDILIILGDAGINYYLNKRDDKLKEKLEQLPITLFCIKGNHEKYPENIEGYKIKDWNKGSVFYQETYPSILFAKDGEIYNLNNNKTLVIGGAYSVDKFYRLNKGYSWFDDEQPSEKVKEDVIKNLEANDWIVDTVLSHTCPAKVIPKHLFLDCIDQSTVDNSTEEWLQTIADKLKFNKWYYGHYHGEWLVKNYELMFENIKEF